MVKNDDGTPTLARLGKDGKIYGTMNDKFAADSRWEQQQQQNKLLAQQNELIAQQSRDKERLAREQMANDMAIESSRQQHEKEMRLLNLCDSIGISKSIMDSYIDYLNDEVLDNYECKKELNKIDNKIYELEKEYYEMIHNENLKKIEQKNGVNSTNLEPLQLYEQISNKNYKNVIMLNSIDDESKIVFKKIGTMRGFKALYICMIIMCPAFLIMLTGNFNNKIIIVLSSIICFILAIVFALRVSKMKDELSILVNKKIKKLKNDQKQEQKVSKSKNNKITSYDILDEINDKKNDRYEIVRQAIDDKLKDFYNFRLSHYNSQVEKFLIDFGFKDEFGSDFKVVTKSQAKSNGDVDDYIDYFNNVIDNK